MLMMPKLYERGIVPHAVVAQSIHGVKRRPPDTHKNHRERHGSIHMELSQSFIKIRHAAVSNNQKYLVTQTLSTCKPIVKLLSTTSTHLQYLQKLGWPRHDKVAFEDGFIRLQDTVYTLDDRGRSTLK